MLEEMDSPDVQDFWIFYITNEERFIRDKFTKEQIALACFKAGIECQKKKLSMENYYGCDNPKIYR